MAKLELRKIARREASLDTSECFRKDTSLPVRLEGHGPAGLHQISGPGQGPSSFNLPESPSIDVFRLPAAGARMESPGYDDSQRMAPSLTWDGGNVPALLDDLLRRDRNRFFAVVKVLKELVMGIEELDIATPGGGATRRVDLVIENGLSIPADSASTGVRSLIFFVALAYHPTPARLILVEEPENGIHPRRLADVMRLFREITRGLHGAQPAQAVLTTHSPYLLDFVDLDTDQVLICRREDDGGRTVEPAAAERLKDFLDEFKLGEVWFNEGEERLCAKEK